MQTTPQKNTQYIIVRGLEEGNWYLCQHDAVQR